MRIKPLSPFACNIPWPLVAVVLLIVALIVGLAIGANQQPARPEPAAPTMPQAAPLPVPLKPVNPGVYEATIAVEIAPLPPPDVIAPLPAAKPTAKPSLTDPPGDKPSKIVKPTPAEPEQPYCPQRRGLFRRW